MKKRIKKLVALFFTLVLSINIFSATSEAAVEQILVVSGDSFVADTLNGVSSVYRTGNLKTDGTSTTYSCAAFVKKYYKEVYGVSAFNLLYNKIPATYEGEKFISTDSPQVGDIAACNTNRGTTHWAIVKEVNPNQTVTLIEQNWKWMQCNGTVTKVNRTVKANTLKFYRLEREDQKDISISEEENILLD